MKVKAESIDDYIEQIEEPRKQAIIKLRNVMRENLPKGFEEKLQYDMISFVVPKSIYPQGYHCNPDDDLAFISLGNQKNHIIPYDLIAELCKKITVE